MNHDALDAVIAAVSKVMDLPSDVITETTAFRAISADSIALVVMADVIEDRFPEFEVPTSVLKTAKTVGELAAGLVRTA
jgi:acyl carrier protein